MTNVNTPTVKAPQEPYRLTKRIGSITYEAVIHFNPDARETLNEKILRLMRRDMEAAS
jgi:hypothetical protein